MTGVQTCALPISTDKYKPSDELVEKLVDVVSKGGNFLLNIGPSPTGEFAPDAYARLNDLARWMKINGEAIYGTRPVDRFSEGDRVRFSQRKDHTVRYIYLMDRPAGSILLKNISIPKQANVHVLGSDVPCKHTITEQGILLTIPEKAIVKGEYVWVLEVME